MSIEFSPSKISWLKLIISLVLLFCCTAVYGDNLPQTETENLTLHSHFVAEEGVLVQEGGQQASNRGMVGFWADRSGNGNNLEQTDPDKKPVFLTSVIADKSEPVIRFNGLDNSLAGTFTDTLEQPDTIFLVVNTRNTINEYIFDGLGAAKRQFFSVGEANSGNPMTWTFGSNKVAFSGKVRNGEYLVHTLIFDGGQSRHFINGLLEAISDVGTQSLGGLTLASRYSDSHYGDLDIAELILYSGAADDADREAVENYLMEKYDIKKQCYYKTDFPVADISGDCKVDWKDLSIVSEQWLNDTSKIASPPPVRYRPTKEPEYTDVFWAGMNDIAWYRIPSVVTTPNDVVLAFCEARKVDWRDKSPTKIVLRRSYNGGQSWLPIQDIADVGDDAAMDPTAVVDRVTGRVWLFFAVYPEGWNDNPAPGLTYPSCTVWTTYSDDDGASWSEPENITSSVKLEDWTHVNIGPGVGIQMEFNAEGRLVIPCSHGGGTTGNNHIMYSDDHGQSWNIAGYINTGSESQIVELSNGQLLMNIRGGGIFGRRISKSYNAGMSWTQPYYDPYLVEPVCQASILRYTDELSEEKNRILFCNPASAIPLANEVGRRNLTIRLSYDNCSTWEFSKIIHHGAAGYSCMTVLPDKKVGVLYENGEGSSRDKITFASCSLEWLTDGYDKIED